jgi:hypothetical protein
MEVSGQLHALDASAPKQKLPSTHWMGPRLGLYAVEWKKKSLIPAWNQTPAVQAIALLNTIF